MPVSTETRKMGALLTINVRPRSWYSESSAAKTARRLQFAGSEREATVEHAAILWDRDLDEILILGENRCTATSETNLCIIFPGS